MAPAAGVDLAFSELRPLKEVGRERLSAELGCLSDLVDNTSIALVVAANRLEYLATSIGSQGAALNTTEADVPDFAEVHWQ